MNKLIILTCSIGSQITTNDSFTNWNDPITVALAFELTDSNDPFRASLQWTELTSKNREGLMLRKVSLILGLIIVNENHIQAKTITCLWTKSAVKGDLFHWNAWMQTDQCQCLYILG